MTRPVITRTRAEVYRLWIDALGSDRYSHTGGQLTKDGRFCCLGVLCDLAARDGGPEWDGRDYMGCSRILPDVICAFMGLHPHDVGRLITLNDSSSDNFPIVASHIENNIMPKVLGRP